MSIQIYFKDINLPPTPQVYLRSGPAPALFMISEDGSERKKKLDWKDLYMCLDTAERNDANPIHHFISTRVFSRLSVGVKWRPRTREQSLKLLSTFLP